MKGYKWNQISFLVLFSLAANFLGCILATSFSLPLWLDSFGTFLTAYCLGPWCGLIVGFAGNILNGFIDPKCFIYAITSICMAVTVGLLAKRGWMSSLLKTMSLSVLVTLICVVISCILNFLFFKGRVGNIWGDGVSDMMASWGVPLVLRVIAGEFYVDFLDKVVTLCAVFFFIRIYRLVRRWLPNFFKLNQAAAFLLFFFAALFIPAQNASAQSKDYNSYVHIVYNKENGLPGGKANDIASTNDGILWIGTYEGLYRHNGHEFRLMNEFASIKAVRCLYLDDEGRLFVGTNDNGLSIVINETVSNILEEKDGLPCDSIRSIIRASNGLYYVGTAEATAILSIADGLSICKMLPEIEGAIRVSADEKENISAVTVGGELFIIHGKDIAWKSPANGEKYTAAAFSPEGLLYASTESNRLLVYSVADDGSALKQTSAIPCGSARHINSINFFDNAVFLSADNGASFIEDGKYYEIESGAVNNSIDHMTQDYQGNLWFTSSRQGLLKLCLNSFSEIYASAGLPESVVNSVASFGGLLYFATDDGLTAIDPSACRAVENAFTQKLSNTRIRCLYASKDGALWISTKARGLIRADAAGNLVTYGEGHVWRMSTELSDGTIAAGGNDGVIFIKNGKIISWLGYKDGFENPLTLCLSENLDGTVFAGTDGGGLAILERSFDDGGDNAAAEEEHWRVKKNSQARLGRPKLQRNHAHGERHRRRHFDWRRFWRYEQRPLLFEQTRRHLEMPPAFKLSLLQQLRHAYKEQPKHFCFEQRGHFCRQPRRLA